MVFHVTEGQREASQVYAQVMTELKLRVDAMNAAAAGKLQIPSPFVREFCFLQLRMICELIALGCLAAHGEMPGLESKSMQKAWRADQIMKRLEAVHPDFFPRSFKMQKSECADWHLETAKTITKRELLDIYHKCDAALHRGGLSSLSEAPASFDAVELKVPLQRIVGWLANHIILLLGGKKVFVCHLHSLADGLVHVKIGLAK